MFHNRFFPPLFLLTDDLKLSDGPEDSKVLACKDLLVDTLWGPFSGSIQSDETAKEESNQVIKNQMFFFFFLQSGEFLTQNTK